MPIGVVRAPTHDLSPLLSAFRVVLPLSKVAACENGTEERAFPLLGRTIVAKKVDIYKILRCSRVSTSVRINQCQSLGSVASAQLGPHVFFVSVPGRLRCSRHIRHRAASCRPSWLLLARVEQDGVARQRRSQLVAVVLRHVEIHVEAVACPPCRGQINRFRPSEYRLTGSARRRAHQASPISRQRPKLDQRHDGLLKKAQGGSLSYDGRQAAELEHVPRDEEERVEDLLLFARRAAPREGEHEKRQRAEGRHDEIEDVEWVFPELLIYICVSEASEREPRERARSIMTADDSPVPARGSE